MTSSENLSSLHWLKRLALGLIFVVSAMVVAFAAGAWIYVNLMTPSRGLAGGAEVFLSGITSGLSVGILTAFLSWRMTPGRLLAAALGAALMIAAAVIAFLVFGIGLGS